MRISDWSSDLCSSDLESGPDCDRWRDSQLTLDDLPARFVDAVLRAAARRLNKALLVAGAQFGTDPPQCRYQGRLQHKIGRAPCRERLCQYVFIAVVAGSLKTKNTYHYIKTKSK